MAPDVTIDQIDHNFDLNRADYSLLDNPKLAKLFGLAGTHLLRMMHNQLTLCASLTPEQKKLLWSKNGLPIELVPIDKWPLMYGAQKLLENDAPVYDAVFLASMGDPKAPSVIFTLRTKVWLKDLPPDMRERTIKEMAENAPEKLARADTEPIVSEYSSGYGILVNSEMIKQLLAEIKKDEEKQATEEKKE